MPQTESEANVADESVTVEENPGIKMKFVIHKADGTPCDPDATYFVLRLDREQSDSGFGWASRKAMEVFARGIENDHPALAEDIEACLRQLYYYPCGCREAVCEHTPMFDRVWRYGEDDGLVPRAAVQAQKEKDAGICDELAEIYRGGVCRDVPARVAAAIRAQK